ncbi:MAG: DUF3501 family protein [Pseudomonadota bacterium]|nr:DUF3501 family protein [Pseudomonadota bacterium]
MAATDSVAATRKLTRDHLMSLEEYDRVRSGFRARVMAHKLNRRVAIGPHATLYFEDELTIRYQVQEMLRAERIFEAQGIEEEIGTYNPLIPDGRNWKATFMIEYAQESDRRTALSRMVGIENRVWARVAGFDRVWAIADEDLDRSTGDKTSSVHFLRFELDPAMARAVKSGVAISMGIDHVAYSHSVESLPEAVRAALSLDLAG